MRFLADAGVTCAVMLHLIAVSANLVGKGNLDVAEEPNRDEEGEDDRVASLASNLLTPSDDPRFPEVSTGAEDTDSIPFCDFF